MDIKKTGAFIAACRKEKGLTQKELADVLGITNRAVSKWETGAGLPDIGILEELSKALDVSIDELLKGEKNTITNTEPAEDSPTIKKTKQRTFLADIPRKNISRAAMCFILAILSISMQLVYLILGKRYQLEYIYDAGPFLVNIFALITFLAGVMFLIKEKKV